MFARTHATDQNDRRDNYSILTAICQNNTNDNGKEISRAGGRHNIPASRPCKLTLKVVFESRVTWPTSVPILVFLGISVLDLGPMYATDRQTDVRQTSDAHHRLMPPSYGAEHNNAPHQRDDV